MTKCQCGNNDVQPGHEMCADCEWVDKTYPWLTAPQDWGMPDLTADIIRQIAGLVMLPPAAFEPNTLKRPLRFSTTMPPYVNLETGQRLTVNVSGDRVECEVVSKDGQWVTVAEVVSGGNSNAS